MFALLAFPAKAGTGISFQEASVFAIDCPPRPGRVLSGDWNGDRKADLAVVCGQNLRILGGDGSGGFQTVAELPLRDAAEIAAVDLNSDGRTDLLAYNGAGGVEEFSAFLSEGDFHFASPIRFRPAVSTLQGPPGGPYILGFLVVDLNGDGVPDLLLTLNPPGRDSVMLGRGDGTFADPIPGLRTFNMIGVADFNSDGVPDVMTQEVNTGAQISYGRGDGTFEDPVAAGICGSSSSLCSIRIADIDGDGKPDLQVQDTGWLRAGNPRAYRGNGHGAFELMAKLTDWLAGDDGEGHWLTFADLNADKIPDLMRVRDDLVCFYAGTGDEEFVLSAEGRLPYDSAPALLVDLNGDGKPDLVASDSAQNLWVLLNTSGQTPGSMLEPGGSVATLDDCRESRP